MAVNCYLGKIEVDNYGIEQVVRTVPFVFPHILAKSNVGNPVSNDVSSPYYGVYTKNEISIYTSNSNTNPLQNGIDAKPTNLTKAIRELYQISSDDSNIQDLKNAKIAFCYDNQGDAKYPFTISIQRNNIPTGRGYLNRCTLWFGDMSNRRQYIVINANISKDFETVILAINDLYAGNSFNNMLTSAKTEEQIYFNNGLHGRYFSLPQFAPVYPYYNSTHYEEWPMETLFTMSSQPTTGNMPLDTALKTAVNLGSWGCWHQMIKGTNPGGKSFNIKLPRTVVGHDGAAHDTIELGYTYQPNGKLDAGNMVEMAWSNTHESSRLVGNYNAYFFRYYCCGTGLETLFDPDQEGTVKEVFFPTGVLVQDKSTNYSRKYILRVGANGMECFIGMNSAFGLGTAWAGIGTTTMQLIVTNNFAQMPMSSWIKAVGDSDSWNWNTMPLAFAGYTVGQYRTLKPSYMEGLTDSQYCAGLSVNFPSNNPANWSNIITSYIPPNKTFWEEFLGGFIQDGGEVEIGGGSIGGGASGVGGGMGTYDDSSATITSTGDLINMGGFSVMSTGGLAKLYNMYSVDPICLGSFGTACWSFNWSNIDLFGSKSNPIENILLIKRYPFTLTRGATHSTIRCAGQNFTVNVGRCNSVNSEMKYVNFGAVKLEEYFGNCLDYTKTVVTIYLPYVGAHELDTRSCMGGTLHLDAYIDIINGQIIYLLQLEKAGIKYVICSWQGAIGVEYPVTGRDFVSKQNAIKQSIASGVGGVAASSIGGMMFGGPTMAVAAGSMAAIGGLSNITSAAIQSSHTQKSGNFSGSRAGIKYAYISIERPKQSLPEGMASVKGFASNISSKLGYLSGYTQVDTIHLSGMGYATKGEIEEIERLLKQGVII